MKISQSASEPSVGCWSSAVLRRVRSSDCESEVDESRPIEMNCALRFFAASAQRSAQVLNSLPYSGVPSAPTTTIIVGFPVIAAGRDAGAVAESASNRSKLKRLTCMSNLDAYG